MLVDGNVVVLIWVFGIGKWGVECMVLELCDKVGVVVIGGVFLINGYVVCSFVVEVLVGLGFVVK